MQRAELGEEQEAMIAIGIPEKAGSLKNLCETLGTRSLTEFSYRMSEGKTAQIFMGVEVSDIDDRELLIKEIANKDDIQSVIENFNDIISDKTVQDKDLLTNIQDQSQHQVICVVGLIFLF